MTMAASSVAAIMKATKIAMLFLITAWTTMQLKRMMLNMAHETGLVSLWTQRSGWRTAGTPKTTTKTAALCTMTSMKKSLVTTAMKTVVDVKVTKVGGAE